MIYVIQNEDGATLVAEKDSGDDRLNAYTIKLACDEELRENGGIDFNNLAYHLERNEFTIHNHMKVRVCK